MGGVQSLLKPSNLFGTNFQIKVVFWQMHRSILILRVCCTLFLLSPTETYLSTMGIPNAKRLGKFYFEWRGHRCYNLDQLRGHVLLQVLRKTRLRSPMENVPKRDMVLLLQSKEGYQFGSPGEEMQHCS